MEPPDMYKLGYRQVDADHNVPVLLDTMDVTGRWSATSAEVVGAAPAQSRSATRGLTQR